MTLYFDTSALVKLFVDEDGPKQPGACGTLLTLSRPAGSPIRRTRAALAGAERVGRLSAPSHRTAKAILEDLWSQLRVIEMGEGVARSAGELAERWSLQRYDAVHLASALEIQDPELILATWDGDLSRAARLAGVAVSPPQRPSRQAKVPPRGLGR